MSFASPTGPTDYIDPLNYGTSAETTSTLGLDPLDYRIPPDQYHVSALQIARLKGLLLLMTQDSAGGTRLKVRPTVGNQFGVGESGFQVSASGASLVINGGTPAPLAAAPVAAKGDLIIYTGSGFGVLSVGANNSIPVADSSQANGVRWSSAPIFTQVGGVEQTVSTAGAVTFAPGTGETLSLTATGNITALTVSTTGALPGEIVVLRLIQNAAGTATWPTTIGNVKLPGGSFTKTAAANALDVLTLRFNSGVWNTLSISLNQS